MGGQYGEGALLKNGNTAGYYNTVQLSYGLQAGAQKYGYVLFFMSDSAMSWLDKSDGWELGVGPSIVVVDIGAAGGSNNHNIAITDICVFHQSEGIDGRHWPAGHKNHENKEVIVSST